MKFANKLSIKVIAAFLSMMMVCGIVGVAAYSAGADSAVTKAKTASESESSDSDSKSSDGDKLTKDETVYVIADAKGAAKKIIVSDWIKNTDKLVSIKDKTNLKDIKNTKGDEKYSMDKDNVCVWDAKGKDIYYQGRGTDEIPVDLSVSYSLDGKSISPEELKGKSGKVRIRFDYNNKKYETVDINGKKEKIYVPFIMLTGMILSNEKFSDIQVTNGKIINDGNRTIVAGFALPGLSDSLKLDSDKLDIPSSVEFTADVKDFELSTTLTIATNDAFGDIDFSEVDNKIDELDEKLDKLTDATDKLIDGSSQLYDGISTLLDKSGTLVSGVKALAEGAEKLAKGAGDLDSGAGKLKKGTGTLNNGVVSLKSGTEELENGIKQLTSGLSTLSSNSSALNSGAKQVFTTLLSTADSSIKAAGLTAEKLTIENYSKVLKKIEDSLSDENVKKLAESKARETVSSTVKAQEDLVKAKVTEAVRAQVLAGVIKNAGLGMTPEEYKAACEQGAVPEDVQQQISSAVEGQMGTDAIKAKISQETEKQINALIEENMGSEAVKEQIAAGIESAKSGKKAIINLKTQLDSYNTFYKGVLDYTGGVDQAKAGAQKLAGGSTKLSGGTTTLAKGTKTLKKATKTLKKGTKTLKNGAKTLSDNLNKLYKGTGVLVEGVEKLAAGSLKLNKGLRQYKEEGVDVIVDAVDGDVKTLVERFKAISRVSRNYKSYGGISSDMDGKVDFIYKTDGIEK